MIRSYFARYRAVSGTLIGGVAKSQSSRYDSRADAEMRLTDVILINGGPAQCVGEVCGSEQDPEIFIHCGSLPQARGARCFGCGKLLTEEDARAAAIRP